jgi:hypothetical protein
MRQAGCEVRWADIFSAHDIHPESIISAGSIYYWVVFLPEPDDSQRNDEVEKLKKELAKLEWEEKLLRKRDDRLKWEQDMLQMEEGLKTKVDSFIESGSGDPAQNEHAPSEHGPPVVLEPGTTYIILEETPQRSVSLYQEELKNGMTGLFITRSNPKHVSKRFDLGSSKICWLTGVKAGEELLSISGLQELSILVSNAIDENNKSVVLLDGVEYLISNNDFPIVLRLIQQMRDKVSTSDSKMILPVNPNALDSKQLTLLQRECHKIV